VVSLFATLCVLGIRTALRAPDRFGMLLAAGVTAWFGTQAFVNIGAVIGILPITGVPLPFVSYGGSSLLFSMFGAGLLLNVARQVERAERRRARRAPAGRPAAPLVER
jgi:cell division protein FtsW